VLLFAATAEAQAEPLPTKAAEGGAVDAKLLGRYSGSYTYADDPDQGRAIIKQAFDQAIEQVPRLFRPFMRKRMAERDYLVTSFSIRPRGERIAFRAQSYKVFSVSTQPGVTRELTSRRGHVTKVTQRFIDGSFELTIENRRGQQRNLLTLADDGRTMRVETTFTSRYLDGPVTFELRYARVEPPPQPRPRRRPRRRPPQKRAPMIRARRVLRPNIAHGVKVLHVGPPLRRVPPTRGLKAAPRPDGDQSVVEVTPSGSAPEPRPDQGEHRSSQGETQEVQQVPDR